jgi:hypothetical protein
MSDATPSNPPADTPALPPFLSLAEAVPKCGVSKATLQRRLKAGAIPGAERTPAGGWRIPVAGLIAAGLAPKQTPPDPPAAVAEPAAADPAELVALRAERDVLRAERDAARELAAAHKATADLLADTLSKLAPALPVGSVSLQDSVPGAAAERPRRRFWQR